MSEAKALPNEPEQVRKNVCLKSPKIDKNGWATYKNGKLGHKTSHCYGINKLPQWGPFAS